MGRVEEGFGGVFDEFQLFFLRVGEGGVAKKERGGVDDFNNAGFEFEREPKEKVGFIDG